MEQSFIAYIENSIKTNWDLDALTDYKGATLQYKDVARKIEKLHIIFESSGIQKGDKIAICGRNSSHWGVTFLATLTYGAVVVPILHEFKADNVHNIVNHSEAKLLFVGDMMWENLNENAMPLLEGIFLMTDFSILVSRSKKVDYAREHLNELFGKKYPKNFRKEHISYHKDQPEELAVINYTSGTTSAPKGVMIRYDSLSSNVEFGIEKMPCYPGENIVSMLPMAHMYGMVFEFLYPLCGGVTINFLGKTPTPALLLGAMAELKPYLVITVPLVMEKIFRSSVQPVLKKPAMRVLVRIPLLNRIIFRKIHDKLMNAFGGQVRCLIMGGAALNPEVEAWFKKFRLLFTVGYCMTEGAPLFGYAPWTEFVPHSCGKKVDRIDVRIDSADPQNIVGEIQVKGVNVMEGYYRNPEATAAAFTEDGWLRTGDLGVIDRDGNIFIRGRSKNMILSSNGQNIYPEEVESVLNSRQYVSESVVVDRDSKLVGLVYLDTEKMERDGLDEEGRAACLKEIMASANRELPAYSRLSRIEVRDEPFEKTPKMSIRRFLYK